MAGKITCELALKDAEGTRICRDFISKLFNSFTQKCFKCYETTEELIYAYDEKQLYSALIPAIAEITKHGFLMEQPVTRKTRGEKEYSGKMDIWAQYKNYSFAIEIKHSYTDLGSDGLTKGSIDKYKEGIKQIRSLKPKERELITVGNGLFLGALLFTTFSIRGDKKEGISSIDCNLTDIFNEIRVDNRLKPKPNLFCFWKIPEKLKEPVEYENYFEAYPALGVIGYFELN